MKSAKRKPHGFRCGIFAYVNFAIPKNRKFIVDQLLNGLRRLEYRGYDSAGIAIDSAEQGSHPLIYRSKGNISVLTEHIQRTMQETHVSEEFVASDHVGIAHTRWATHGPPSEVNSDEHEFIVVHNGIITNYLVVKNMLMSHGFVFVSETDTEVIAKLAKFVFDKMISISDEQKKPSFATVIIETCRQLSGAFACLIKSRHYPGELIACKRGSPLIVGLVPTDADEPQQQFEVAFDNKRKPSDVKDLMLYPGSPGPELDALLSRHIREAVLDEAQSALKAVGAEAVRPSIYVLASDPSAVVEHTRRVLILEDDDMVHIKNGHLQVHHNVQTRASGQPAKAQRIIEEIQLELDQIMKGSYPHYMLKEIHEQSDSVMNTMAGRVNFETNEVTLGGMKNFLSEIRRSRRLVFCACGTSFNSALATRQIVEELSDLPVALENASDLMDRQPLLFRYMLQFSIDYNIHRDDTVIFISQSGETADTLSALKYASDRGAFCVGITNTVGSSIARLTSCGIHINAGVEIGVASTKAYTSQMIAIVLFAMMLGSDRLSSLARRAEICKDLKRLPELIKTVLALDRDMEDLAEQIYHQKSLLLLGRGYQFASCVEGALKIKEVAYLHTEGLLAGELKHGPLALVDEHMPTIILAMHDKLFTSMETAFAQIRARSAHPVVLCNPEDVESFKTGSLKVFSIPKICDCLQGLLTVIPLQLLSYYLAVKRGHNVDQPRNLAKSVTTH